MSPRWQLLLTRGDGSATRQLSVRPWMLWITASAAIALLLALVWLGRWAAGG